MTKYNFISKFIKVVSFCLIFISFLSPFQVLAQSAGGSSTAGPNGAKFYQDRVTCTTSYYNVGDYARAASCYEGAGQAACPTNSFACDWSKANKILALNNYKNNTCNPKYYAADYNGAGGCYDTGIKLSCNSVYNDANLCSIFTSNKKLVNCVLYKTDCLYNTNVVNNTYYDYYSNEDYLVTQLYNYKSNCNQNWPNYLNSFINCSQQGASDACRLKSSNARDLCNIFNSNVALGQKALQNCGYNNYYNNYYSNCSNTNNDTVTTVAAIATGVVLVGCLLGACNGSSSNSSYNSGGSGGGSGSSGGGYFYGDGSSQSGGGGGSSYGGSGGGGNGQY